MKRKFAVFVSLFLIFNLACGKLSKPEDKSSEAKHEVVQEQTVKPQEKSEEKPVVNKPQTQAQEGAQKAQAQPKAKPKTTAPSTPKAVVSAPVPPTPSTTVTPSDIGEVERMVLSLVNDDRRKNGLPAVVWDETAAKASQQHVQDEADVGFISHWSLSGVKPQLRYTRAGGKDVVDENESVTLWLQGGFNGISKADLYKVVSEHESAMLNEQPPNDGHRQNILDKHHTGLGVAIAVGKYGVAMAQEFTNHYADLSLSTTSSNQVVLNGRIFPGYKAYGIYAVWETAPKPMSRDQLMQTKSYSDPPLDNLHFWARPDGSSYYITTSKGNIFGYDLKIDAQGNFSLPVPLATSLGLDYITLEIAPNAKPEDRFYAGQFVVEIK